MYKIGDRIFCANHEGLTIMVPGVYPPIGTHGTIIDVNDCGSVRVRWDEGVILPYTWYIPQKNIRHVEKSPIKTHNFYPDIDKILSSFYK